jgi:2-succinyl-5-enolpyruvyl-6-hydroxy-3-cyclohexene-1-carboxylate synthase
LRKNKALEHWHLQLGDNLVDTFQSVTKIIPMNPLDFLTKICEDLDFEKFRAGEEERDSSYKNDWISQERKATIYLEKFFNLEIHQQCFNEFFVIKQIMDSLPENSQLHLANSMSVRYANYIGVDAKKNIEVFANRGTSGIDGCVSTAVGQALSTEKLVFLLVGDVAFFYDRNGLWNRYLPDNLRIILLNNHGGGIFRIIEGPNKQSELEDYFETIQAMNAQNTALDAGLEYYFVDSFNNFDSNLEKFNSCDGKSKLFEIETVSQVNADIFKKFKSNFL